MIFSVYINFHVHRNNTLREINDNRDQLADRTIYYRPRKIFSRNKFPLQGPFLKIQRHKAQLK